MGDQVPHPRGRMFRTERHRPRRRDPIVAHGAQRSRTEVRPSPGVTETQCEPYIYLATNTRRHYYR
ncbi:hypothetical protein T12_1783 [Trichinella patagoniensis]|uniref:Uncharacterized protein n=1 Tax=Trichinella patagoniensis TaxID=990121 RepID=A0A0V0Z6T5_9BILA|nr:hypothetical protein T12_1783 [Trichinella patagoniensis]